MYQFWLCGRSRCSSRWNLPPQADRVVEVGLDSTVTGVLQMIASDVGTGAGGTAYRSELKSSIRQRIIWSSRQALLKITSLNHWMLSWLEEFKTRRIHQPINKICVNLRAEKVRVMDQYWLVSTCILEKVVGYCPLRDISHIVDRVIPRPKLTRLTEVSIPADSKNRPFGCHA